MPTQRSYVVQTFNQKGRKLVEGPAQKAKDDAQAKRIAAELAPRYAGVVALELDTDPDVDFVEAKVIASFGVVPEPAGI